MEFLDLLPEGWKIISDRAPDRRGVYRPVHVSQEIAHSTREVPGYLWMTGRNLRCETQKLAGSLTDDLEVSDNRVLHQLGRAELRFGQSCRVALDAADRLQHVRNIVPGTRPFNTGRASRSIRVRIVTGMLAEV